MTTTYTVESNGLNIEPFFHAQSSTLSYVVYTNDSPDCIVVDPVLDFDMSSGTVSSESAAQLVDFIERNDLVLHTILETHAHADHMSAAMWLKQRCGARIGIGSGIKAIQQYFAPLYGMAPEYADVTAYFDFFVADGDVLSVGDMSISCIHVPGHTPACMAYGIADAVFVGDTLFMPDAGTARCDFPGGSASQLFQSARKLLALPADTRIFVCHDYQPNGRELHYVATVAEHREANIHINDVSSEEDFVTLRTTRDSTLSMPSLILPSLQVNIRAGQLPRNHQSNQPALTIPLNVFSDDSGVVELISD